VLRQRVDKTRTGNRVMYEIYDRRSRNYVGPFDSLDDVLDFVRPLTATQRADLTIEEELEDGDYAPVMSGAVLVTPDAFATATEPFNRAARAVTATYVPGLRAYSIQAIEQPLTVGDLAGEAFIIDSRGLAVSRLSTLGRDPDLPAITARLVALRDQQAPRDRH
jgi:hypothetical protein